MNAFTTTALIGVATAALVLGVQRHRITSLEERADEIRTKNSTLESRAALPDSQSPPSRSTAHRPGAPRTDGPASSSGASNVEVATVHARLDQWIASKNFKTTRAKEIVANFSELLELVADCRGEDLQELVDLLGGVDDQQNHAGMVAIVLQMLAVEYDPLRYLRPEVASTSQTEVELQSAALSALARRNPNEAMSWLLEHSDKIDDRMRDSAYAAVSAQAFRRNVDSAVQFLSKLEPHHRQTTLTRLTATGIRESRAMIEAAGHLPEQELRQDFYQAGVASIMAHEGIEAGRATLKLLDDTADYGQIVTHAATIAVEARPDQTMAWLMEAEAGSAESEAVAVAIASWAGRDYKAAAEWLGIENPSPNRDLAIQSFAQTVQRLDPKAATIWATEISDPDIREKVLRANLEHWKSKDAEAAAAWEAKQ